MPTDTNYQLMQQQISEHLDVVNRLLLDENSLKTLEKIIGVLISSFKAGGKLLICGNGGSAADSQHIATEFVSRFLLERVALDAESLTVNTSSLTAIANDYSFDRIFARQVEAKGKQGDLLLAISTSGNSMNVIEAVRSARNIGMITIGLTGGEQGTLIGKHCDYSICVPSKSTARIQEAHILIGHIICEVIEKTLFERGK